MAGNDEFYDLQKDPGERHNAFEDPAYAPVILKMQREQLRWYQATCDIVPLDFDARFNKEMLWAMMKSNAQNDAERSVIRESIDAGLPMAHVYGALAKFRAENEKNEG